MSSAQIEKEMVLEVPGTASLLARGVDKVLSHASGIVNGGILTILMHHQRIIAIGPKTMNANIYSDRVPRRLSVLTQLSATNRDASILTQSPVCSMGTIPHIVRVDAVVVDDELLSLTNAHER